MNKVLKFMYSSLTKKQINVIELHNKGNSQLEIAEIFNISQQSVRDSLDLSKRKLIKFNKYYLKKYNNEEQLKLIFGENWKGGDWRDIIKIIHKEGQVSYNIYKCKLDGIEEIRRDPNYKKDLQVKCSYCKKWFSPKRKSVEARVGVIYGYNTGECRFYCSQVCKDNCCEFNQKEFRKGQNPNLNEREQNSNKLQKLRQEVLKRDGYKCVWKNCKETKNLKCHHILPWKTYPEYRYDINNLITYCTYHHYKSHQQKGCTNKDLRSCILS